MSKKFITALIAVLLCICFAFSACGGSDSTDKTGGSNTEQSGENTAGGSNTEQSGESTTGGSNAEQGDENDDNSGFEESEEITEMYITVGNNKLKVTLAENSTVDALAELLKKGDITYTAHANNFEIYGDIGHSLPTNNTQLTSGVGDVFLWAGSNICIFFGNNSYSYTRIGKIEGYTAARLKEILAPTSNVQVTISLK